MPFNLDSGIFCGVIEPALSGILIPVIFSVSFIAFLWAVFYYAIAGEYDEYARDMAKSLMLWGILAFLFMVIVWAMVGVVYDWVGVNPAMCG